MTQIIPTYTNNNGVRQRANVITSDKAVILSDGRTLKDVVDESKEIKKGIKNALDDMESINVDTFSPVITQTTSTGKIGKDNNIDVSANVNDGFFKSVILKGQTLVNLGGSLKKDSATAYEKLILANLQKDKKYFARIVNRGSNRISLREPTTSNVVKLIEPSTKAEFTFVATESGVYDVRNTNILTTVDFDCLIIEYQDGMENWDISYFEGMQSVKMPVLSSVGKNLFNIKDFLKLENHTDFTDFGAGYSRSFVIRAEPNTTYVISRETNEQFTDVPLSILNSDRTRQAFTNVAQRTRQITTTSDGRIYVSLQNITQDKLKTLGEKVRQIQLEKGTKSTATSYEPYKSNILTVNEDIALHSNGSIYDELDLVTGQLTQRLKIRTVEGNSPLTYGGSNSELNQTLVAINLDDSLKNSPMSLVSDKLPYKTPNYSVANGLGVELRSDGRAFIVIPVSNYSDVKIWLTDNPITFLYPLATPVVKRVPINGEPLGFKDGHIMLSSGSDDYSLIPTLEYSVPVSKSAQITQNTATFARQSKQIYSLEILMMSASIEDAYRRLLLQNDVEVTRSINANLEANPLRYYVLSKLIEENAYNVDDMLDKLDIFSLYNEITIDQYIELSDNVLGINEDIIEGEIIED